VLFFTLPVFIISICKIKGLNIKLKHTEQRRLFVLPISLLLKTQKKTHFIFFCIDSQRREAISKEGITASIRFFTGIYAVDIILE